MARKHDKRARVAIYARVSTMSQDHRRQLDELRSYCTRRGWASPSEYVDHGISGAAERRPELDQLMADARRGRVDVVAVWALDRLGRSLRHLVTTLDELAALGVGFVASTQGIDTTHESPAGRFMLHVLSAVAEFERSLIRERVVSGVARARAEGVTFGRPCAEVDVGAARALLASGAGLRAVARELGQPRTTIRRALARTAPNARKSRPRKVHATKA